MSGLRVAEGCWQAKPGDIAPLAAFFYVTRLSR